MPFLAEIGLSTVRVFERVRVGVIALLDDGRPPVAPSGGAAVAATMMSAAVEQMGAKALWSSCRADDEACLVRSARMFAAECSLVLIVGSAGGEAAAALGRCELSCVVSIRQVGLDPFGQMQFVKVGAAHMISLPADPAAAFATFTAFVSPLLRALAGRFDVLPPVASAVLIDGEHCGARDGGLVWVREQPAHPSGSTELVACPATRDPPCLAAATGLAWCPPDLDASEPAAVAYLPFRHWIG